MWKKADTSPGKYWMKTKENHWLRDTMIGDGVVNFEECMKILMKSGYQGYLSLENSHPEPFEEGVKQAMECIRKIIGTKL